jgi:hypothetical protein
MTVETVETNTIPGDRLSANHPPPFRGPIEGPSVWYGPDLANSDEWIYELSSAEQAEILAALRDVQQRGLDIQDIRRGDFPLPAFGARLDALRQDVLRGRGFVLLRGVPISELSFEETATLYWGLGTYIGNARPQNVRGHLLGHVTDIEGRFIESARGYLTSRHLKYHCDYVDIVSLLCVRKSKSGGLSSLVSSHTIHNEMQRRRPDLAARLYRAIAHDRHSEVPPGKGPWYELPVFNHFQDQLSIYFIRNNIESAAIYPDALPISPELNEAMDMVQALANDPALHLQMAFEPGDIQLIHNHQIMHERTAYEDWPEPDRKRHLLRLWLSPSDGVPLPEAFAGLYGGVDAGARGGVSVPDMTPHVPLKPV